MDYEKPNLDGILSHDHGPKTIGERLPLALETWHPGWGPDPMLCLDGIQTPGPPSRERSSDIEMMKERFAKLLLGEDMSGGGKGVSSALALSNAITNLAASVFGEQRKLQPMPEDRKSKWRKEINWLLSVTDHIVELVPSQQASKDGTNMEIMVTLQRKDLSMNIPALRKLDNMLLGCLDNFGGCNNEFWYGSKDDKESEQRKDDKWWLPTVRVPSNGLSTSARKWLVFQKESVNQVLKAAMAINAQVLSEMEIPEDYIESLPKNGRSSLGESIYKSITVEHFDPNQFLSTVDLSTEHKVLDLKNRIEASIVIWRRKMNNMEVKSSWATATAVSLEKRELFEERAETILILLKQHFPGLPQSSLDISKIQDNRDVGQAVLESYSRVIESLAYTVLSRIEDVLEADSFARDPPPPLPSPSPEHIRIAKTPSRQKITNHQLEQNSSCDDHDNDENEAMQQQQQQVAVATPTSVTLSDMMGWTTKLDKKDSNKVLRNISVEHRHVADSGDQDADTAKTSASPFSIGSKVTAYLNLNPLRTPSSRH